jgi:hypothetical protein
MAAQCVRFLAVGEADSFPGTIASSPTNREAALDQTHSQHFQTCDEFVTGNYGEQQKHIDKEKTHEN